MKIEGVVIACYKHDLNVARICVASVRFWYQHLPVLLLKDLQYGDFDTREIEEHWGAQVYPSRRRNLGWGFGKLEVMTELPERRLLIIDSDVVFAGRLIERLEKFDEDVVVHKEDSDAADIESQFFSPDKLRQLDPTFSFAEWGFNTGQVLATTGRIKKEDMNGLVDWGAMRVRRPDIFKMGEQGLTNYVVQRKLQDNQLTVRRESFMVWPGNLAAVEHIQVADLAPEGKHQELIHWAGLRWGRRVSQMPRADILLHFEDSYYSRIPRGRLKRAWRMFRSRLRAAVPRRPIDALRRLRDRMRWPTGW